MSEIKTADGLRSVLQLRSAERNDMGEYRCHAENEYGRSELLMYLHVEGKPERHHFQFINFKILIYLTILKQ